MGYTSEYAQNEMSKANGGGKKANGGGKVKNKQKKVTVSSLEKAIKTRGAPLTQVIYELYEGKSGKTKTKTGGKKY